VEQQHIRSEHTMNAKTLKALKDSIAHWKRMATGMARNLETPKGDHCALCRRFYDQDGKDICEGCPVKNKTGHRCCNETPYYAAWIAHRDNGMDSPAFRRAAEDMLAFLQSLLPPRKPKPRKKI